MSLASMLTHTAVLSRTAEAGGMKRSYQVTGSAPCLIQPLDLEAAQSAGMAISRAFRAFFLIATDITEGDRIVDQDGAVYGVKSVARHNYGRNQHIEALLEKDMRP